MNKKQKEKLKDLSKNNGFCDICYCGYQFELITKVDKQEDGCLLVLFFNTHCKDFWRSGVDPEIDRRRRGDFAKKLLEMKKEDLDILIFEQKLIRSL